MGREESKGEGPKEAQGAKEVKGAKEAPVQEVGVLPGSSKNLSNWWIAFGALLLANFGTRLHRLVSPAPAICYFSAIPICSTQHAQRSILGMLIAHCSILVTQILEYRVDQPAWVCWDETHFGKMASWYINRYTIGYIWYGIFSTNLILFPGLSFSTCTHLWARC